MLRPTAKKVYPKDDYFLEVEFTDGEIGYFDVKPYIKGNWFGMLRNKSYFERVIINGITVEWPDVHDICPDDLYYLSKKDGVLAM